MPEGFCFFIAKLSVDIGGKIERDILFCFIISVKSKVDMLIPAYVKTNNKRCLLCVCYIIRASEAENTIAFNCQRIKELAVYTENGNGIEIAVFHRNTCKEADGRIIGEMIGLENGEKGFASLNIT